MLHEKNIKDKKGIMGSGRTSHFSLFILYFTFLIFLLLGPCRGIAQTPAPDSSPAVAAQPVENRMVAVMPFIGDDPTKNARVQSRVIAEVENQPNYTPVLISATNYPEALRFRPDEPPDPMYLGDMPFVLTGEYYLDIEGQEHFQLWLWNSFDGSLVYTDELVAEDIEEAEGYLPAVVNWIFSRIPRTPAVRVAVDLQGAVDLKGAVEDVIARTNRPTEDFAGDGQGSFSRFYMGMWLAGSTSSYFSRMTGNYDPGMSQGFGINAAFLLGYRPWRFLSFQVEGIFNLDVFRVFSIKQENNQVIHTSNQEISMSLLLPLLFRIPLVEEKFSLSPILGPYFIISMGHSDERGSYQARWDLPIGIMLGMDMGYSLGPGELFVNLRYGQDFGTTIVSSGLQYTQNRVMISVGYRFEFIKKPVKESRTIILTGTGTITGTGTGMAEPGLIPATGGAGAAETEEAGTEEAGTEEAGTETAGTEAAGTEAAGTDTGEE